MSKEQITLGSVVRCARFADAMETYNNDFADVQVSWSVREGDRNVDPTRATASYVVEQIGPYTVSDPDEGVAWTFTRVLVRRLTKSGEYSAHGERLCFFMSDRPLPKAPSSGRSHPWSNWPCEPEVVGKMRMTFVRD